MIIEAQILQRMRELVGEGLLENEPLSAHTTFRVGGPARWFVKAPADMERTKELISLLYENQIPFYVLGRGSNILASDRGFPGLILDLSANLTKIVVEGTTIYAQAGASLSALAHEAMQHGLTGLEFAAGIPGTVGGAVCMNAGAYGGEMCQVITAVNTFYKSKEKEFWELRSYSCEEMDFGYRHSLVDKGEDIVLSAAFSLKPGDRDEIRSTMEDLRKKRVEKQPLQYPSAGSTFKRPEGYFAGKLVMDAGLAGYTVGGAQISPKHCGFVVNIGEATATDVWQVCKDASAKVYETFGVRLEPEVRLLGEFDM